MTEVRQCPLCEYRESRPSQGEAEYTWGAVSTCKCGFRGQRSLFKFIAGVNSEDRPSPSSPCNPHGFAGDSE